MKYLIPKEREGKRCCVCGTHFVKYLPQKKDGKTLNKFPCCNKCIFLVQELIIEIEKENMGD